MSRPTEKGQVYEDVLEVIKRFTLSRRQSIGRLLQAMEVEIIEEARGWDEDDAEASDE